MQSTSIREGADIKMEWSIAEKSLHIICVSFNNKRVHGIMPRSLKKYYSIFYNDAYLTYGYPIFLIPINKTNKE